MRCPSCGAELSEDSKFCSYCGCKLEKNATENDGANVDESEKLTKTFSEMKSNFQKEDKASKQKVRKSNSLWSRLSLYGKIVTVAIIIFVLLCVAAFLSGKTIAGVVAVLQIILIVIAVLIKKEIINTPSKWLTIIPLVLAFLLLFPYSKAYNIVRENEDEESFIWTDIVLGNLIPQTPSLNGKINTNSENSLSVDAYNISHIQYNEYIEACKNKGFTIDAEESTNSYSAYSDSGYELYLSYYASSESMRIRVNAVTQYGTMEWPESGMAEMIPVPVSTTGEVIRNNDTQFYVYVSNTHVDEFNSYVELCKGSGFVNEVSKTEKSFSAQNSEGYRLKIMYEGNNVISISLQEPEYEVSIEVECVENLLFSKYDVKVYVNNSYKGTVEHGVTQSFTANLTKGTYEVKFVNAGDDEVTGSAEIEVQNNSEVKYKISCTSSAIKVEVGMNESSADDTDINISVQEDISDEENPSSSANYGEETENETATVESEPENESTETETGQEAADSVYYSTNSEDTVKNGNAGVYAYKSRGGTYDTYWIIDFDEGCIYWYTDGNGDSGCERVQIVSGDLNSVLVITYHDGDAAWSYGLHFRYKNTPDHLIVQDEADNEYDYYATDIDNALALMDGRAITDY